MFSHIFTCIPGLSVDEIKGLMDRPTTVALPGLGRAFAVETDHLLGKTVRSDASLADYVFESQLGVGGTSATYLAQRASTSGRSPAVMKVILPRIVDSQGTNAAAFFLKEAVALGRLNERTPPTPFVVRLLDVGYATVPWRGGSIQVPWLAIEYVSGGIEGTTLRERVQRSVELSGYAFDRARAARALKHITTGLDEVHAVTPSNVLCCNADDEEMFKLSDFGIARPVGIEVTFGAAIIGTPGYMAPEQVADGKSSIASDIFSLACLTYFLLTGESYVPAKNAMENLALSVSGERPRLLHARTLCPELREDPVACAVIDDCLMRATARDPAHRPGSAQLFGAAVFPSLTRGSEPASDRVSSARRRQISAFLPQMAWNVRHPPGDAISVLSAGWDGDGHCLAVTNAGLRYWDGCSWIEAPPLGRGAPGLPHFVRRVGAGRWLCGGDGATLFEYSRNGVGRIVCGKQSEQSFLDASGSLDDVLVVAAQAAGSSPVLLARAGGRWLKPLPLANATVVNALAQIDDERWLVVGRGNDGFGFACRYSPLDWEIEPVSAPLTRAYLSCAARRERDVALAVGTDGAIVRLEGGVSSTIQLADKPDLVCTAIDILDREWVGGLGCLWASPGGSNWTQVWRDPTWARPFISIHADVASVIVMAVDGGILECWAA
jgi:serine/threonine protein kinase